ncbi:MAG: peptide deformylase [Campylobacteraceae bacterium]|jgi:peptide deformylase|nr:peptide deformylase [Campylobacteraceae bacterium]
MVREILTYPNPKLREASKDVKHFDESLHTLLDDMYETMLYKNGVGLAAIQVGVALNALVINPLNEEGEQNKEDLLEFINPQIIESDGIITFQEGCLSVPSVYEEIERFQKVKVKFFDRFGKEHAEIYKDFMAVALQHEIDHLRGHLFIEKLTYLKRKKFEKEWKKRIKEKAATL